MLSSLLRSVAMRLRTSASSVDASIAEAAGALNAGNAARAKSLAGTLVKRDPGMHEAWNLLGAIALTEGDEEQGLQYFDRAVALDEGNPDYLNNAGEACRRAGRYEWAVDRLEAALKLHPGYAAALYSLAMSYAQQWRPEEAFDAYQRMLAAQPGFCRGHQGYLFFVSLYRARQPDWVCAEHRRWAIQHADPLTASTAPESRSREPDRPFTVGYVSADFNRHAVWYFIEPILRHHDRDRFRIALYSNTSRSDEVTSRFASLADIWRDISSSSDADAVAQIRGDGVDVLVDLSGHTAGNRLLAFARRPAPVQMTYLGYPSGTGMAAMDFRITDRVADAGEHSQDRYRERLLYLPDSLWCYEPPAAMHDAIPEAPSTSGDRPITFGSFNHVLKITPQLVALWARILHALPAARLVMAAIPQGLAQARIAAEFAGNGIDPQRVRMLARLEQKSFWAVHREIDIALDSFPCNGGTTSCETLWLGVPMLTLVGDAFISRVGLSLLSALGLEELAARSEAEFLALAVALANDHGQLAALRRSLSQKMRGSALMDAARCARELEALYIDAQRSGVLRRGS